MNHIEILKRAFHITWRYRPLWLFGFLLALCGGSGGGGGGGGNVNVPGGGDFGEGTDIPAIDPGVIIGVIVILLCLALILAVISILVRQVTRTALIGMVGQIRASQTVTMSEGWRFGWSARAWRLFLVSLIIGVPLFIISIFLILLAFSPLLLLLTDSRALIVAGVILTILGFLFVILLLVVLGAIITPLLELAWRRTVLDQQGVLDSLGDTFGLIKRRFKDVAILWLLMIGVGIVWGIIAFIIVLPVSLFAGGLAGGIPALLVWILSNSVLGAAIAGLPLGLLTLILVASFLTGFYLVFQSAVWTLGYLELQEPTMTAQAGEPQPPESSSQETPETDKQTGSEPEQEKPDTPTDETR